jgi:hypothetical protein
MARYQALTLEEHRAEERRRTAGVCCVCGGFLVILLGWLATVLLAQAGWSAFALWTSIVADVVGYCLILIHP